MSYKKKTRVTSKPLAPATDFPPFTNLTNNLSLQQHQYSAMPLFMDPLNEASKHNDLINETRYPVYTSPLNETTRYPVTIIYFFALISKRHSFIYNKLKNNFFYR